MLTLIFVKCVKPLVYTICSNDLYLIYTVTAEQNLNFPLTGACYLVTYAGEPSL